MNDFGFATLIFQTTYSTFFFFFDWMPFTQIWILTCHPYNCRTSSTLWCESRTVQKNVLSLEVKSKAHDSEKGALFSDRQAQTSCFSYELGGQNKTSANWYPLHQTRKWKTCLFQTWSLPETWNIHCFNGSFNWMIPNLYMKKRWFHQISMIFNQVIRVVT